MTIPVAIQQQADFLMAQNKGIKHIKEENSKSLLSNVLDLNDDLIYVAGENFKPGSKENQGSKSLNGNSSHYTSTVTSSSSGACFPFENGIFLIARLFNYRSFPIFLEWSLI